MQVVFDDAPPLVTIDSPPDNAIFHASFVTVTGMVNDIVSGSAGSTIVDVNGVPADVDGRRFMATNVPVSAGANTIIASATDSVGNTNSAVVTVIVPTQPNQARLELVSGRSPIWSTGKPTPITSRCCSL